MVKLVLFLYVGKENEYYFFSLLRSTPLAE